ncbi:glycoside hydrolase family 92 protein [Burkholderia sp. AU30198]|uniref:glycoside hydrolase domain-containing protein n=1 Tax=Burkholderia sp. AU30198 TaxID=2879627 RepID=UPI001CF2DF00|nr:glycoside hydrolase domain-containing protein [Burkholderia sp. AU30198]MCA8298720.1 glycoside hydrolase family 92 protein [Burkholderia sp. AU30198]
MPGGKSPFIARLDRTFDPANRPTFLNNQGISGLTGRSAPFFAGSEPANHLPYLHDVAGMPSKTQDRVCTVMDDMDALTPTAGHSSFTDAIPAAVAAPFVSTGFVALMMRERHRQGSPIWTRRSRRSLPRFPKRNLKPKPLPSRARRACIGRSRSSPDRRRGSARRSRAAWRRTAMR